MRSLPRSIFRALAAVTAVAGVAIASACLAPSGSCPSDLPASCPDGGGPSYQADVAPILAQRCVSCHSPGGIEGNSPLDSYAAVFARRGAVLDQVYACRMPQDAPLSAADRQTLMTWLVCDAPNN